MKKRKNKQRKAAPKHAGTRTDQRGTLAAGSSDRGVGPFSIRSHVIAFGFLLAAALGIMSGLKDFVELSPRLEKLAEWYLAIVEWPWRQLSLRLGLMFYPELAVQMTAVLSLIVVVFSSLWLQDRHDVKSTTPLESSDWREWHLKRQLLGICSAVVASGVFVFTTEHFVLGSGISDAITRYPLWYWSLHILVVFVFFHLS